MNAPPPTRIFGIVATEAPIAVLFRRGPSKLTQMLTWNLNTDEIVPGQWIQGKVFTRRCDLSRDGKLLVTAISNYSASRNEQAALQYGIESYETSFWTAVSRPPYFSALALWFFGPSYNGGGSWLDERVLGLNNQPYPYHEAKSMPRPYRYMNLDLGPGEDRNIWSLLQEKRGWYPLKQGILNKKAYVDDPMLKRIPGGFIRHSLWGEREIWELLDEQQVVLHSYDKQPPGCAWVDVDHRGRLLIADRGHLLVWEGFPAGQPRIIADLNGNTFEEVAPPEWALRWP